MKALLVACAVAAAASPAGRPATPAEYATAIFAAWRGGDQAVVEDLADPTVAEVLGGRAPEAADGWEGPQCEGAAGSTYCSWVRPETQLVLQIANEAASHGEPHAGTGATFAIAPAAVAIWPYTTATEAANSQEQVDAGHSPWQLSPEAVALGYADAVLGWHTATATPAPGSDARFTLANPPNVRATVDVDLAQPVRPGDGGIWAITRASTS
jgi:hypothetical protein